MNKLLSNFMPQCQSRVEGRLSSLFSQQIKPLTTLQEAMAYSVLNGGKRFRAILVYASGVSFGCPIDYLDPAACAVELVHAYSLIHDDLPAMDNSELRRGKAACHIAFDEATAILAGDALQALAFEVLSNSQHHALNAEIKLTLINTLADASGTSGMAGGQAIDLASEQQQAMSLDELDKMHQCKTGALIKASLLMGIYCCSTYDAQTIKIMTQYADCIGLAFQIQDDILDIVGDPKTLGKPHGADEKMHKVTYPALIGLEKAQQRANQLCDNALTLLEQLNHHTTLLAQLSRYVISRNY